MKKYLLACALVCALPSAASAQDAAPAAIPDFTGARVEARVGWETPTVSSEGEVFKIGQAVSFGGEAGFDFQLGERVVAGPYATYELSGVEACADEDCLEIDDNLGAGVRVGYQAAQNGLVYVKLGYARMGLTLSAEGESASGHLEGFQGALGYEMNFGGGPLYGRIEANYADLGSLGGINFQRRHVALGLGARF
jgi:outer membrane immunogenic protein